VTSTKLEPRERALQDRRAPDEFDQLLRVARPQGWMAATALGLIVLGLVLGAVFLELPRVQDANGAILYSAGVREVQATADGEVLEVSVRRGERVAPGDEVALVRDSQGRDHPLVVRTAGQVAEIRTAPGRFVELGADVLTVERGGEPEAVLFLEPGTDVRPGLPVDVFPAGAGRVPGTISDVSLTPASDAELRALLASPALVRDVSRGGPPIVARVDLAFAPGDLPSTTPVAAEIQRDRQSVLDMVFG
jgi:hypothetical protein